MLGLNSIWGCRWFVVRFPLFLTCTSWKQSGRQTACADSIDIPASRNSSISDNMARDVSEPELIEQCMSLSFLLVEKSYCVQ